MSIKRILIIFFCIFLLITSTISFIKFRVINPFSSFFGMMQILCTDKEYTVVQYFPTKVVFSKPTSANIFLDDYMKKRGYQEDKNQRIGSTLVFYRGNKIEKINFTVNGYYSKWQWY